jgi:maltooligosyltrehalose trehalohydrolase
MRTFRVWATIPKQVELAFGGKRLPMKRGDDGWWTAEISPAQAGNDYGFVPGDEGPFPDPRSPSQPNGVDGLSRLVDQNAFPWTDKSFQATPLAAAIIYECTSARSRRRGRLSRRLKNWITSSHWASRMSN